MKLGLKKEEVILVPYEKEWKNEYERVKKEILNYVNLEPNQIEHIGSTAINGMKAKPIIDILIGVEQLEEIDKTFYNGLQQAGFYRLKVERPNEVVCAKFLDESFEVKTHFIHLVEVNKEKWKQLLFFRDYLNANSDAKIQYETIKASFFMTDLKGINAYTDYKEEYVKGIISKMHS
ncbi:GrpB family protein [Solibacillus sp. FSL R7-0682]|uniref:GrpB family protein n=1 Tax=Solibacillus sp. FSL R7-0682 TaxID=2921690 RepID=UPI0030F520C6